MISVDTNVLLRRLLNDDPSQLVKVAKLFEKYERILIPDIVLVETIWTLKGKRYKATREDIAATVMALLEEPNIVFESLQAVWSALNEFINAPAVKTADGQQKADFPDALLVAKSRAVMGRWGESYEGAYTFDQAAQALTGAKLR